MIVGESGRAQRLEQQFPFSLPPAEALLVLDQDWQHDGLRFLDLPFELHGIETGEFLYMFDWTENPSQDSLYIYLGGVAGEAEIELNGRFLGIQPQSLKEWVIGIHGNWLKPTGNELTLQLHVGEIDPLHARPFLGIVRPVEILTKEQLLERRQRSISSVGSADTVGIVAPYFRTTGFGFDTFEALRNLYPLKQQKITHLYFPFPAGERFRSLCVQTGFVLVDSLTPETYVCPINAYPYEPVGFPFSPRFWIDEKGNATEYYGNAYPWKSLWVKPKRDSDHVLLAVLVIFPLLVAFFIKLLNPGFFSLLLSLLFTPKRYVDTPNETLYTNKGLLWSLVWVRTLSLAIFMTLILYYVQVENQWKLLNIFRDWSLLSNIFYPGKNLEELLLVSVGILIVWVLFKYGTISFIGGVFRIKAMASRVASLDVLGTYPIILVLPIPISLILFMDQLWGGAMLILLLTIVGIYLVRHIYVLYIGLDRFFGFSSAMKILYICTFIIVPYMVWF